MKQLNKKAPAIFYVGVVLLCMVLVSTHFTSGLYARYTATSSVSDRAVVARFDINDNFTSSAALIDVAASSATIDGGAQQVQTVQITNTTQTNVTYTVKAQNLTGNLPIEVFFGSPMQPTATLTGTLAPNETIDQNIQIQWTDVDDFSWTDDQKDPRFAGRVDLIRLTVSLEQTNQ